jgi:hypothetical protein
MSPEILHALQVVQQEAVDVDIRGHEQALHKISSKCLFKCSHHEINAEPIKIVCSLS